MNPVQKFMEQLQQGLPPATDEFNREESTLIEMRDGVSLKTSMYFPAGTGPWPVIVIRNPYAAILPILAAEALLWTQYGYAVVLQDCRGTGGSAGNWTPFVNERNDGLDTIQWIMKQSWMNGNIGTYGHSYLSAVQWVMADRLPNEVKAMVLSGFTTERYRQYYMNGMFRHDVYTGWAIENSGVKNISAEGLFQQAVHIRPHIEMDEQIFGQKLTWYRDWITNVSPDDDYWSAGFWSELKEIPKNIHTPILMTDGWFDQHLDGMVRDYHKLPEATRRKSRFLIGPWVHSLQPSGDLTYPGSERNGFKDALEWFDHHLKGMDYAHPKGDVQTYVMGEGIWREWDHQGVQPSGKQQWFLNGFYPSAPRLEEWLPGGLASISYRYDPTNPVPTKGGAGLLRYLSGAADAAPPASMRQEPPGYRDDVITFESKPLERDLRSAGAIEITLYVSSDAEDTSFTVNVIEVLQDGSAYNIRDGITSLSYRNGAARPQSYIAGSIIPVTIELWPITWTIKKGSRIRLDVSSSNFPAYHAHANEKGAWALQKRLKAANQTLYFGADFPARMIIPFIN